MTIEQFTEASVARRVAIHAERIRVQKAFVTVPTKQQIATNPQVRKEYFATRKALADLESELKKDRSFPAVSIFARDLSLGNAGHLTDQVKVLQVIEKDFVLCTIGDRVFAIQGIDASNIVDDDMIEPDGIWQVSGRFKYNTALNTSKTVFVLSPWKYRQEWEDARQKDAKNAAEAAKKKKPAMKKNTPQK